MAAKHQRRMKAGASRVTEAMQVLAELRQAILDGKATATALMYCDELAEVLYGAEAAVGVCTPASLFSEDLTAGR